MPSTPDDPSDAVLSALEVSAEKLNQSVEGVLQKTALFVHGTTVGTNTILEKKGANVGLITSSGFRDSLEIRRGYRYNPWDHRTPYPEVIVPRSKRLPVKGKIDRNGTIVEKVSSDDVKTDSFTKEMINNFFAQARSSYAEGLASLYTYERQIPEIAETKIQGLKKFYGVSSKEGLEFFEAHKSADVVHRAECEKLLDGLSKEEQEKAEKASLLTAKFLWNFLSGMTAKHKLEQVAA